MSDDSPATAPALNPFEPGYFDNPYDQYGRIREQSPVHRFDNGPWLITRWDDVHTVLRRPNTSVDESNLPDGGWRRRGMVAADPGRAERANHAILNLDPPDHTRLRRLVSKAFTPRAVEQIRSRTAEITEQILDDLARRDEPVDLIAELAFPLPFTVISELLGMPEGDRDQLRSWSHTLTQILDPLLLLSNGPAIVEASDRMNEVVTAAVEWKRGRDDDDLLTALIRAEDGGDVLTDAELIDNVTLLYLAGHETTVNLIGNGTNALLNNPDQMEQLIADPSLDVNAIEELLRYDSPVQFSRRIATEPFEIDGHRVEAGQMVMTGLGAANRDPAKFGPDADRLDLSRADAREHVSFGSGVHHCLGAALARLEGQEVIGRLVRRFPTMERAGDPVHNQRLILRGYDQLPVSLTP